MKINLIKLSDDTAIVDLLNSIPHYIVEVERLTSWCERSFWELNVTKTKELLIDLCKQPPAVSPIKMDSKVAERFEKYKILKLLQTAN